MYCPILTFYQAGIHNYSESIELFNQIKHFNICTYFSKVYSVHWSTIHGNNKLLSGSWDNTIKLVCPAFYNTGFSNLPSVTKIKYILKYDVIVGPTGSKDVTVYIYGSWKCCVYHCLVTTYPKYFCFMFRYAVMICRQFAGFKV